MEAPSIQSLVWSTDSVTDLGMPQVYCCFKCGNHVCFHDDIVNKDYVSGRHRAFLFSHATNTSMGPEKNEQLITGNYLVADVHCSDCGEKLGWKYVKADQQQYKHKEGKFAIVKFKINKLNSWH